MGDYSNNITAEQAIDLLYQKLMEKKLLIPEIKREFHKMMNAITAIKNIENEKAQQ